jgi:hypothetical protein
VAQIFTNEGLTVELNQIITGSPVTYGSLYVGLFTGSIPTASATLASGLTEQGGTGYSRQLSSFGSPATASTSVLSTTLNGAGASGSYVVTLTSVAGLAVGMNITVGTESVKVITGLPGSSQVVLSSALSGTQSSGAAVTAGDAVNGVKSTGAQVTFTATGTWSTATTGYFVATVASGTSGKLLYAANFADASTPTLSPNDTLKVTPVWLKSN